VKKKEMIAMLLAGGQGSRLGILTATKAKPVVSFGGKYRVIDFPMSNCINSGVDTVGVMTQYQPLRLNQHIGIGIPWDLDRRSGGVTILAPHMKSDQGEWYTGTANAIYQNIEFIENHNPDYVLILSGDHIYKMNYAKMLDHHKQTKSDVTIAALEVPWEEASRFGLMNADEHGRIYEFEEKPSNPKSNLANMGIYIFNWPTLRDALERDSHIHPDSDFGMHVLPMLLADGARMYTFPFSEYWMDVGTIESYWMANMDLVKTLPDFNLYENYDKIYTDSDHQPPMFTGPNAQVRSTLLSEGCEVMGEVYNSVLGPGVIVDTGAIIRDSIIMENCYIGNGARLTRVIADAECSVGDGVIIGEGANTVNQDKPKIYNTGITVLGENTTVPDGVTIGKNCVVYGPTYPYDYPDGRLESGQSIIREPHAKGEDI